MSVRLRLALTFSVLMAALLGVGSAVLYLTMRETLGHELDRRLQIRASEVRLAVWSEPGDPELEDIAPGQIDLSPLSELDAPGLYVQALDLADHVLATSDNLHEVPLPVKAAQYAPAVDGKRILSDVTARDGRDVRVLSVPITVEGKVAGVLQVGQSRQPLEDTLAGFRRALLLFGSLGMMAGAAGGWLVAHRGLRPLSAISAHASEIATRRDFSRRLRLAGGDEISQLAAVIDQLLETVDETLHTHQNFVADTSHELRNPLLAIQTNLDLLDDGCDEEDREECFVEIRQQVERMSRLVADLLLLAQVEPAQMIEQGPVGLAPLVRRAAREAERRATGQTIRMGRLEPLQVLGDEGRLTQILTNLVDNALRHTPPGGAISLSVERDGQTALLVVLDTGEGIEAEHLPRIFDRAYRACAGASFDDSNGLGLAIVKHLAEAHGGGVEVDSELGRGSRFAVWLPLTGPPGVPPRRTGGSLIERSSEAHRALISHA